ncbi:DinB family protein, partial [Streptomyces pharetrae]|uniref:DinB family protein n=1 Tax=Streptomyces pharetrae TaxID=291370 RepID=UPI00296F4C32
MTTPSRLSPLLRQYDFARERLADRMTGPVMDSGDGADTEVGPMTDEEYLWEPVPGCWSIRPRVKGPGPRATFLAGVGDWGRDAAPYPHPWPPPFTTIAWRLSHPVWTLLRVQAPRAPPGEGVAQRPVGWRIDSRRSRKNRPPMATASAALGRGVAAARQSATVLSRRT